MALKRGHRELRDGFVYPLCIRFGLGSIRDQDASFIAWARTGVPELVEALKAERAQRDQDLKAFAKNYAHITIQLEAARAENERLLGIIEHVGWPQ